MSGRRDWSWVATALVAVLAIVAVAAATSAASMRQTPTAQRCPAESCM